MSIYKTIFSRSALEILFKGIQFGVLLIIGGYSIKVLGLEVLGTVQLLRSLFIFFSFFFGIGLLGNAIIHHVAMPAVGGEKETGEPAWSGMLSSSINLVGIFSLIFFLVFLGLVKLGLVKTGSEIDLLEVALVVLTQYFTVTSGLMLSTLMGLQRYNWTSIFDGTTQLIGMLILFVVLFFGQSVMLYLIVNLLIVLVRFFVAYGYCRARFMLRFRLFSNPLHVGRMELFNKNTYLGGLAQPFSSEADKLLLGGIAGVQAVPLYNLAQSALSGIHGIVYSVASIIFPLVSRTADKKEILRAQAGNLQWVLSKFALLAYCAMIVIIPWVSSFFLQPMDQQQLVFYLCLAGCQGMFVSLMAANVSMLLAMAETKILAICDWIATVGTLCMTALLTILLGAVGTGLARLWYIVPSLILNTTLARRLAVKGNKFVLSWLFYVVLAAIVGWFSSVHTAPPVAFWLSGALFVVGYCAVLAVDLFGPGGPQLRAFLKKTLVGLKGGRAT